MVGKWVAPGAALVLIPKCPLCIVGYFAAVTGVGLSISTAQYLRVTLIVAIFVGAACLGLRTIVTLIRAKYCIDRDKPL